MIEVKLDKGQLRELAALIPASAIADLLGGKRPNPNPKHDE